MSYLTMSGGIPDFTKAVISLWFRVPQASINAATESFSDSGEPPLFNGIIPLVVMGTEGYLRPYGTVFVEHIELSSGASYDIYHTGPTGDELPVNPSIIGVNCDPGYGRPALYVNFETSQKASVSDLAFELAGVTETAFSYTNITDAITDYTAAINGTNIYLDSSGSGADEWHHVLISLELQTISVHGGDPGMETAAYVDSAARLFVALDDVDYTEFDLSNHYVNGSEDRHAIVPEGALNVAGKEPSRGFEGETLGGIPQYALSDPKIPCSDAPMGLPGTAQYVNNIYRVEMAEFQMFTGLTLDTGVTSNRRAFVDNDGKPVPPEQQSRDDNGNIPGSIELLGKRPEILLHGNNKWIAGYNTGTIGVFTPVAGIEKYKPEPSLEETTA